MKLLFKECFFSWLDSYDIYDEAGNTVYTVEGRPDWGHRLHILDAQGSHVGTVREKLLTVLPKFEMYVGEEYVGCIQKQFTFFKPKYDVECRGWQVEGDFVEWNYTVREGCGGLVATVSKDLTRWTDTYSIDLEHPEDALAVLMLVVAIDAEKCSKE